jgi:GR25 family glycosyltransferase involved in LPS biosynthesis
MKKFIIRLADYPESIRLSEYCMSTAKNHGWQDLEYFDGVNGLKEGLRDYNLKINKGLRKARKGYSRGTAGCFLSHYNLWKKCVELNETICILEHDCVVEQPFPEVSFQDVIKFTAGEDGYEAPSGYWTHSSMAYCVSPAGAEKLVRYTDEVGVLPPDMVLGDAIVDLVLYDPINSVIGYLAPNHDGTVSFCQHLEKKTKG